MEETTRKVRSEGIQQQYCINADKIIYDYTYTITYQGHTIYVDLKKYYSNSVYYDNIKKVYFILINKQDCTNISSMNFVKEEDIVKVYLDLSNVLNLLYKKDVRPKVERFDCEEISLNYPVAGYHYLLMELDKLGYTNYNGAPIDARDCTIDIDSLEEGNFVFTCSYLHASKVFNLTIGRKSETLFIKYNDGKYSFYVMLHSSADLERMYVDEILKVAELFIRINEEDLSQIKCLNNVSVKRLTFHSYEDLRLFLETWNIK